MTAEEIKKADGMYSEILDLAKMANARNNARPDDDPLWVMCKKCDEYTDGAIIIKSSDIIGGEVFSGTLSDCVAKYAEICINAGADESDIYLGF